MLRSIASVGGLTLLSRVLGAVRDTVTAALLGAGPVADAFFVAFRLPNHFRALLAEGAFNASFVPLFNERLVQDGREGALLFAERILAILLAAQLALLALFEWIMPAFITVFAPGFSEHPMKFQLAVLFTRITFPYLMAISLTALLGGVLNSVGRFSAAAAAPILMNLCLIAAQLGLTPILPTAGHALAVGVLLAGLAQLGFLAWCTRRAGWGLGLAWPRLTPEVRRFFRVFGPAAVGAGLVQINLFFDTLIASLLPTGAVSFLYYADRVNQLPLGVIGVAVGTVLLPELSRQLRRGEDERANHSQNRALELSLLLTLPAAVIFIVTPIPIVSILFRWHAFTSADAQATGATLIAYATGLPAFVAIRSLVPGFHARADTRTPMRIAFASVVVNIGLKLALMGPLAQVGLALATSVAAWVNAGLLAWLLLRRGLLTIDRRLARALPLQGLACLALAAALLVVAPLLHDALAGGRILVRIGATLALLTAGGAAFLAVAWPAGLLRRP